MNSRKSKYLRRATALMLCLVLSISFLPVSELSDREVYADEYDSWENITEIGDIRFTDAKKVKSLINSSSHAIIDGNNDLYISFDYSFGQETDYSKIVTVKLETDVKDVYEMDNHYGDYCFVLKLNGDLMMWNKTDNPPDIIKKGVDRVIATSDGYVYYISTDGKFCRLVGELNPEGDPVYRKTEELMENVADVVMIRSKLDEPTILKKDGTVWGWDFDDREGGNIYDKQPKKILDNARSIGYDFAITNDDDLYDWN